MLFHLTSWLPIFSVNVTQIRRTYVGESFRLWTFSMACSSARPTWQPRARRVLEHKHTVGPSYTLSNACVLAQSRSSFVGGSMAMLLLWQRINGSCARRKSKMGWTETCRRVLGVTCNKPMRVPPAIPFKSQRIWLDELIFWQRVCSLRWDRCMTTLISNFKWLSLWPNNRDNSLME